MATVVTGAFMSGLSTYSAAQGVASVASGISSIMKGRSEARQSREQAAEYERAAAQTEARAETKAKAKYYAAETTRAEADITARDYELQAEQDYIDGQAAATDAMKKYIRTVGQQRVAWAASGVDVSSGTAARMQDATEAEGRDNVATEERSARIKQLGDERKAMATRRQASYTARQYEDEAKGIQEDAAYEADSYRRKAGSYRRAAKSQSLSGYLAAAGTGAKYVADVANRGK